MATAVGAIPRSFHYFSVGHGETFRILLFDEEKAPFARGYFLDDYVGLTTAGNLFLTVFITTETDANPTDAFVVYAEP